MGDSPIIVTTLGDPCGIGPEVVLKALAAEALPGRHVLIGDARVAAQTLRGIGAPLSVRAVQSIEDARFERGCVDVLDPGTLQAGDIRIGEVSPACGRATVLWWKMATELAHSNLVGAIVKGPVNAEAQRRGASGAPAPQAKTFLFLITGPLRVIHLTDHITLREMLDQVRLPNVLALIRLTHRSLERWGIAQPRIGVAGLNPHCYGPEDEQEVAPAVQLANSEGIRAFGPVPPDSLFRQCIEGHYDCVLAHYHDQGHIAVKTFQFSGNCALMLNHEPILRLSVAHGTAFDIAGKGIADHRAMAAAMKTAATLAAGEGFPTE
jgi:4-hydroxy-L-threonine phosphate dehydrogenase PdxA